MWIRSLVEIKKAGPTVILTAKHFFLVCLFFQLITFAAFHPALKSGYIWDDDSWVTGNTNLETAGGLKNIWVKPETDPQYYPLALTTFWIEHQAWGIKPFGYHFINILLHGLNAFLLWLILRSLGLPGAIFAATIFAIHPVHVESVAWITERKNLLSGFFYLLSLLCYLKFAAGNESYGIDANARSPKPGKSNWYLYGLSLLLFVCALLSKSQPLCRL